MDQNYRKKLELLQQGSGMGPKTAPVDPTKFQTTPEEQEAYARAMQQLMMNSPTRGQVQPNAQDLMQQGTDEQSQLNELMGEEPQPTLNQRYQKLFKR